jgi:hypothetical protein
VPAGCPGQKSMLGTAVGGNLYQTPRPDSLGPIESSYSSGVTAPATRYAISSNSVAHRRARCIISSALQWRGVPQVRAMKITQDTTSTSGRVILVNCDCGCTTVHRGEITQATCNRCGKIESLASLLPQWEIDKVRQERERAEQQARADEYRDRPFAHLAADLEVWADEVKPHDGRYPARRLAFHFKFGERTRSLVMQLEAMDQAALAQRLERHFEQAVEAAREWDHTCRESQGVDDADEWDCARQAASGGSFLMCKTLWFIDSLLQRPTERPAKVDATQPTEPPLSKEARALAILVQHPDWTDLQGGEGHWHG